MIGDIIDTIVDGIGSIWETATSMLGEINIVGFLVLTIIGEAMGVMLWIYTASKGVGMFPLRIKIIAHIMIPVVAYLYASHYARKD